MKQGIYHVPVLLQQVVEGLHVQPAGTYVDCTFGGGGHSKAILNRLDEQGKLIAFDQDEESKNNLPDDDRLIFVPHNFRHLQRFLRLYKITSVDGVMADLGVSSHQFDSAERGFSTRFDAELDMRMDKRSTLTASHILKTYSEEKLHKMFEQYGEVTNSKTLAKTIVQQRAISPIERIAGFKSALHQVVKGNPKKYFSQVFQALRIEINDELASLTEMLKQVPGILKPGGRIAIITFHSLEDRLVKNFFKGNFYEQKGDDMYGIKPKNVFNIITKKPILPGAEEIRLNPRARSAKLRIAEKT